MSKSLRMTVGVLVVGLLVCCGSFTVREASAQVSDEIAACFEELPEGDPELVEQLVEQTNAARLAQTDVQLGTVAFDCELTRGATEWARYLQLAYEYKDWIDLTNLDNLPYEEKMEICTLGEDGAKKYPDPENILVETPQTHDEFLLTGDYRGENIATYFGRPKCIILGQQIEIRPIEPSGDLGSRAVNDWLQSKKGHRETLLCPHYDRVGFGVVWGAPNMDVWIVQRFSSPNPQLYCELPE